MDWACPQATALLETGPPLRSATDRSGAGLAGSIQDVAAAVRNLRVHDTCDSQ